MAIHLGSSWGGSAGDFTYAIVNIDNGDGTFTSLSHKTGTSIVGGPEKLVQLSTDHNTEALMGIFLEVYSDNNELVTAPNGVQRTRFLFGSQYFSDVITQQNTWSTQDTGLNFRIMTMPLAKKDWEANQIGPIPTKPAATLNPGMAKPYTTNTKPSLMLVHDSPNNGHYIVTTTGFTYACSAIWDYNYNVLLTDNLVGDNLLSATVSHASMQTRGDVTDFYSTDVSPDAVGTDSLTDPNYQKYVDSPKIEGAMKYLYNTCLLALSGKDLNHKTGNNNFSTTWTAVSKWRDSWVVDGSVLTEQERDKFEFSLQPKDLLTPESVWSRKLDPRTVKEIIDTEVDPAILDKFSGIYRKYRFESTNIRVNFPVHISEYYLPYAWTEVHSPRFEIPDYLKPYIVRFGDIDINYKVAQRYHTTYPPRPFKGQMQIHISGDPPVTVKWEANGHATRTIRPDFVYTDGKTLYSSDTLNRLAPSHREFKDTKFALAATNFSVYRETFLDIYKRPYTWNSFSSQTHLYDTVLNFPVWWKGDQDPVLKNMDFVSDALTRGRNAGLLQPSDYWAGYLYLIHDTGTAPITGGGVSGGSGTHPPIGPSPTQTTSPWDSRAAYPANPDPPAAGSGYESISTMGTMALPGGAATICTVHSTQAYIVPVVYHESFTDKNGQQWWKHAPHATVNTAHPFYPSDASKNLEFQTFGSGQTYGGNSEAIAGTVNDCLDWTFWGMLGLVILNLSYRNLLKLDSTNKYRDIYSQVLDRIIVEHVSNGLLDKPFFKGMEYPTEAKWNAIFNKDVNPLTNSATLIPWNPTGQVFTDTWFMLYDTVQEFDGLVVVPDLIPGMEYIIVKAYGAFTVDSLPLNSTSTAKLKQSFNPNSLQYQDVNLKVSSEYYLPGKLKGNVIAIVLAQDKPLSPRKTGSGVDDLLGIGDHEGQIKCIIDTCYVWTLYRSIGINKDGGTWSVLPNLGDMGGGGALTGWDPNNPGVGTVYGPGGGGGASNTFWLWVNSDARVGTTLSVEGCYSIGGQGGSDPTLNPGISMDSPAVIASLQAENNAAYAQYIKGNTITGSTVKLGAKTAQGWTGTPYNSSLNIVDLGSGWGDVMYGTASCPPPSRGNGAWKKATCSSGTVPSTPKGTPVQVEKDCYGDLYVIGIKDIAPVVGGAKELVYFKDEGYARVYPDDIVTVQALLIKDYVIGYTGDINLLTNLVWTDVTVDLEYVDAEIDTKGLINLKIGDLDESKNWFGPVFPASNQIIYAKDVTGKVDPVPATGMIRAFEGIRLLCNKDGTHWGFNYTLPTAANSALGIRHFAKFILHDLSNDSSIYMGFYDIKNKEFVTNENGKAVMLFDEYVKRNPTNIFIGVVTNFEKQELDLNPGTGGAQVPQRYATPIYSVTRSRKSNTAIHLAPLPQNLGMYDIWPIMIDVGRFSKEILLPDRQTYSIAGYLSPYQGSLIKAYYSVPEAESFGWSDLFGYPYVDVKSETPIILDDNRIQVRQAPIHMSRIPTQNPSLADPVRPIFKLYQRDTIDSAWEEIPFTNILDYNVSTGEIYLLYPVSKDDPDLLKIDYTCSRRSYAFKEYDGQIIDLNPYAGHSSTYRNKKLYVYVLPTFVKDSNAEIIPESVQSRTLRIALDDSFMRIGSPDYDPTAHLIGVIYSNPLVNIDDLHILDIRKRGGGLKPEFITDYSRFLNEYVNYWDFNLSSQISYQKGGYIIVRLPKELANYFTKDEIEKIIRRDIPAGVGFHVEDLEGNNWEIITSS